MKIETQKKYPDFTKEVDNLPVEALKARIVQLQQGLEESEQHKEENIAIEQTRAELKELTAPYRDIRKAVKLKTSYLLDLLKEKEV